ncbi:MAG: hypothetical protein WAU91_08885, partial [Desulfatitalea sp.]
GVSKGISPTRSGNVTPPPTPSVVATPAIASPDKATTPQKPAAPKPATQVTEVKAAQLDRSVIERNRGLTLYDPRRPQRYWTGRQSKHATHEAAMASLAAQYERPTTWVEEHLGEENDLGAIHARLIAAVEAEEAPSQDQPVPATAADPLSHDPREPLASQGIAPQTASTDLAPRKPAQVIPAGIPFYDPRRPEKYWASPTNHYTTLKEAIQSLSEAFGVPITHIEAHMGDSNDLAQIYANIQISLESR